MLEPGSSGAPMSPRARMRATEALFRERAAEIVAAVVRQAEAGDRAAMRLARRYGLPVGPTPEVLAARLAESIARTRATVATLLAEGGIDLGKDSRLRYAPRNPAPAQPAGAQVIASSDVKTRRRAGASCCSATKGAGELVNINENTSAAMDGAAAGRGEQETE
jgi:hypothetical protein